MGTVRAESEKMILSVPTEVMTYWVSQIQPVVRRELKGDSGKDQRTAKDLRERLRMGETSSELSVKRGRF